jgi:hypothetical protein
VRFKVAKYPSVYYVNIIANRMCLSEDSYMDNESDKVKFAYLSRALIYYSGSVEGLSVETVATDWNL